MAEVIYQFPDVDEGEFLEIQGVSVRRGMPIPSTGWLLVDPDFNDLGNGNIEVNWHIPAPLPQSTVALDLSINNHTNKVVDHVTVHWGDGSYDVITEGYGVVDPDTVRASHIYSTTGAVVTVDATGIQRAFGGGGIEYPLLGSNTFNLTSLPVTGEIDVDQIRIFKSPKTFVPEIFQDWSDVTGLSNPLTDIDRFSEASYMMEARVIDDGVILNSDITRSSWTPVTPTGFIVVKSGPYRMDSGSVLNPPLCIERTDRFGYRLPDNSIVTLASTGDLGGTTTKRMYDGRVCFDDLHINTDLDVSLYLPDGELGGTTYVGPGLKGGVAIPNTSQQSGILTITSDVGGVPSGGGEGPSGPDPIGNHPYMIRNYSDGSTSSFRDTSQAIPALGNYEPHTWLGIVHTPSIIKFTSYGVLAGYNNTINGLDGWKFAMIKSGSKLRLRLWAAATNYDSTTDLELDRKYVVAFTADDGGVGNTTIKVYSLDIDTPSATMNVETLATNASLTNSSSRYNLFRAEALFSMPCGMCGAAWWNRALSDAEISEMANEGGLGHFNGRPEPLDYASMSTSLKTDLICYHELDDESKSSAIVVDSHTGGYDLDMQSTVDGDAWTFRTPGPGQPDSAVAGDPTDEYIFQHEWRFEELANGPWFRDHGQASGKSVIVSGSEELADPCVIDAGGCPVTRDVVDAADISCLRAISLQRSTMVPTMDTSADYVIAWVTDMFPDDSPDQFMMSIRGQTSASYRLQAQWPGGGTADWYVEWYRANILEAGSQGLWYSGFRQHGTEERQWHTYQLRIVGNVLEWWTDGIEVFKTAHNEATDTFRDQIETLIFGGRDNSSDGLLLDGGDGAWAWAGIALASDITAPQLHQYMIDRLDERTSLVNTPLQKIRPENNPPLVDPTYTAQTFVNLATYSNLWHTRAFFDYQEEEISTRSDAGTTYLRKWGSGLTEDLGSASAFEFRNVADDTTQPRVNSDHYEFTDSTVVLTRGASPVDPWRENDGLTMMVAYFPSDGGSPNYSIISQSGNSSFFCTLDVISSNGTVRMIDGLTHTSSSGAMVYDQWVIIAWLHEESAATDRVWINGGSPIIDTSGGSGTRDGALERFLGIGSGSTAWRLRDFIQMRLLRHVDSSEYLTLINELATELDARTPGASVWSTAT